MANNSIPKAFHTIEKREMTVSEYDAYLKSHKYQKSIKAITCVECGDLLTYCDGEYNRPYFKHSPTDKGHRYCSLYHEGKESKTDEATIRRKLFKEADISLNYELLYINGTWGSIITIPPFKKEEIEKHTLNGVSLNIKESYRSIIKYPVDNGHFEPGQVKRISIVGFPYEVSINISSNSNIKDISFDMKCFNPNNQIYSCLILQNYDYESNSNVIDLKNIKSFTCKKISGHVYTGKHYLIISRSENFNSSFYNSKSIKVKKIKLKKDYQFDYYLFDIVFESIDEESNQFCANRECQLVEKNDAIIIWPPVKTIGNYRYYPNNKSLMFIAFENQFKVLDMNQYPLFNNVNDKMYLFFQIRNVNTEPFYVTLDTKEISAKDAASIINKENIDFDLDSFNKLYLTNKGVILHEFNKKDKLSRNNGLLVFNNPLDRIVVKRKEKPIIKSDKLIDAIRYSREYIKFDMKYYKYLIKKYSNNQKIIDYIEISKRSKMIKKQVLKVLLEE